MRERITFYRLTNEITDEINQSDKSLFCLETPTKRANKIKQPIRQKSVKISRAGDKKWGACTRSSGTSEGVRWCTIGS